jgi:predicted MFS family arabinose efflux permease
MTDTTETPVSSTPTLTNAHLATMVVGRSLGNLPFRITSPFLPAIARSLGVSLASAGVLASVIGGVSILAPLLGRLSDTYGRRRMMQLSLLILGVMAVIAATSTNFNLAILAFAGFGFAKGLYDPAVLAYVGDAVPYAQRGRVMAITELAWSAAWFFGVPLGGLLIERVGIGALWWVVAVAAFATVIAIQIVLPPRRAPSVASQSAEGVKWQDMMRNPKVWAVGVVSFGMLFGLDNIFILYGAYMEDRFALGVGTLGLLSVVISIAELLAELGSAGLTDRIGKQRSVILGLVGFGVLVLLLPFAGGTLWLTLLAFAAAICVFEYTIVSFLPLVSEIVPQARATILGIYIGALGVGRIVAPLVGTRLYESSGSLVVSCIISAIAVWLAALVTWRGLPEHE